VPRKQFIATHFRKRPADKKFLERYLESVRDDFAYFYLLFKIHKSPWKTRPIVSVSGSLLQGLGQWVDVQLQLICARLPFPITSSTALVERLRKITVVPTVRFFTCDAVSMYTNIDTPHAMRVIEHFLLNSPIPAAVNVDVPTLMKALRLVMSHNVFRFGDTYWVQRTGTAMGTPPAPMYATLYFAIHELVVVSEFRRELPFYGRYIDDVLGLWRPDRLLSADADRERFELFQKRLNEFGQLRWTFSERALSVDFLDLTITILPNGRIDSCLFEKALNLYLYLPPHSNHPPGMARGLIRGMFHRINRLTTDPTKRDSQTRAFFRRLRVRGYDREFLLPLFAPTASAARSTGTATRQLFLHVPFHACATPSRDLQRVFRHTILSPTGLPPLAEVRNHRNRPFGPARLTVAYHRSRNLGNVLSPRRLPPGIPVSSYLQLMNRGSPPTPSPSPNLG
jgi:hypothetical protein